jgi:hypothetical protein
MMHPEFGERIIRKMCEDLADVATPESSAKMLGKALSLVLAPGGKKKVAAPAEKNEMRLSPLSDAVKREENVL